MAFIASRNPVEGHLYSATAHPEDVTSFEVSIKELTASNRALHSVVLDLAKLLSDTSRFASYPLPETECERLQGDSVSWGLNTYPSLAESTKEEVNAEESQIKQPQRTFDEENEQARSRHEERRQKEMNRLKSKASYKCKSERISAQACLTGQMYLILQASTR